MEVEGPPDLPNPSSNSTIPEAEGPSDHRNPSSNSTISEAEGPSHHHNPSSNSTISEAEDPPHHHNPSSNSTISEHNNHSYAVEIKSDDRELKDVETPPLVNLGETEESTALGSSIDNFYFMGGKDQGQAMQMMTGNYGWKPAEHEKGKEQLVQFRSDLTESDYDVVDSIDCEYNDADNGWEVI